jgi:hypothetical protein
MDIRIETTLNGETLYLPQLKPLVGKSVEIIVREKMVPVVTAGTEDWNNVKTAILSLGDYDVDAWREARAAEIQQAGRGDL